MSDFDRRCNDIRARLDALNASDAETCRIADFYGLADPVSEACPRCEVHRHAEDDIAWLLRQLEYGEQRAEDWERWHDELRYKYDELRESVMPDRLQEIRARLDAIDAANPQSCWEWLLNGPSDVEWLLDELEETRHRLACAAIDAASEVAVSSDDREWHLARYGVTTEEAEKASDRRYRESRERHYRENDDA